ncbi:MAG: hypothetical protein HY906_05990 [Deltaproteobacteria bacterium]|nr:hypothetical protein [Deltaproteobacteria bacterium]
MQRVTWFLAVMGAVALSGCGGGSTGVVGDGGVIDAPATGDGLQGCGQVGDPCATPADCCSRACDPETLTCVPGLCTGAGATCSAPSDCCSLSCVNGICDGDACTPVGDACVDGGECCTTVCTDGHCQELSPGGCVTYGNGCSDSAQCCSLNCVNGLCASSFTCASLGDICFTAFDCCTGVCSIASGFAAGTCIQVPSTGAGECRVAGEACTDGTTCCSRSCVPTSFGTTVCQVASGCRVIGELCQKDADCCGASGSGLPGDGNVQCNLAPGIDPPLGRCTNPTGCNPQGEVCGGTGDGGVNARQDCCDCRPPPFQCCKPDSNGVNRCYGGSTVDCPSGYDGTPDCCIPAGGQCSFSAECCEGRPCVPDENGVLRCGATACVPAGGVCTTTGDCCEGLTCIVPAGASTGTCGTVTGDVPDGGTCALPGQHCAASADCCYGFTCYAPGGTPCGAGDTGCTCYGPIG